VIRPFEPKDLSEVMEIWLIANIQVHDFIPKKYWQDNYKEIERVIPISTVYVWEENGHVLAFLGAMEGYVVGHFVKAEERNRFLGKILLDCMKMEEDQVIVSVYEKNVRAIRFYMREDFKVQSERLEESTGEKEIVLMWER
jgi:putative acetyltransferase